MRTSVSGTESVLIGVAALVFAAVSIVLPRLGRWGATLDRFTNRRIGRALGEVFLILFGIASIVYGIKK